MKVIIVKKSGDNMRHGCCEIGEEKTCKLTKSQSWTYRQAVLYEISKLAPDEQFAIDKDGRWIKFKSKWLAKLEKLENIKN